MIILFPYINIGKHNNIFIKPSQIDKEIGYLSFTKKAGWLHWLRKELSIFWKKKHSLLLHLKKKNIFLEFDVFREIDLWNKMVQLLVEVLI